MAPHILIVDDDEEILELFKLLLEDAGYVVDTAVCGREAIEKAKKNVYYLALLDFVLPDIKGTEIASTLYRLKRINTVLFITGYSYIFDFIDPQMKNRCKVLLKPVSGEDLIKSVKEALESIDLYGAQELVRTI